MAEILGQTPDIVSLDGHTGSGEAMGVTDAVTSPPEPVVSVFPSAHKATTFPARP